MPKYSTHQFVHAARTAISLLAAIATLPLTSVNAQAPQPAPRLANQAIALPGTGFHDAAGFDVLDWNLDGLPDLCIHDAGSIGRASIHLNTGTPTAPVFSPIGTPHHYNCTETFPQTIEHNQSRAFCDLNHDNLPDLILFDGLLRYLPNTGHKTAWNLWHLHKAEGANGFFPGSPAMVKENARFSAGPESMFWDKGIFARQVITFTTSDLDSDGLQDLLVCRMKDQQPGVRAYPEFWEQWTPRGRTAYKIVQLPPPFDGAASLRPLSSAPPRETVFYKNLGTKQAPRFDKGVVLESPAPVIAPNPTLADIDGDGLDDLVSSEAYYVSNAFRVDWPTAPHVVWFKRLPGEAPRFAAPEPLKTAAGAPIPAGTMARLADLRTSGALDLLVMDANAVIRWYVNNAPKGQPARFEPAKTITGREFPRFDFMFQPIVVDWFAPGSRDLILHGVTDPHCKWGLRRTTLFKNTSTTPGQVSYQRVGDFNLNNDPTLVHPREQETPYGVYGSYAAVMPDSPHGKRLLLSVDGKLHLFSDLGPDGLTFRKSTPIPLAARRDIFKGWQEFPLPPEQASEPISHIRLNNSGNAMKLVNLLSFEAISDGKNVATRQSGAAVINTYPEKTPHYSRVKNPDTILTPGATIDDKKFNATSFGFFVGPAVIKLAQPAKIQKFRLQFADRDETWYQSFVPFEWQGKTYRMVDEAGQAWSQINIETSPDGEKWTKSVNAVTTEMAPANPFPIDFNRDGKTDLIVSGLGKNEWLYPTRLTYRLYLNHGTEENPAFGQPILAATEKNSPLSPTVPWTAGYAPMCGIKPVDMDADGKLDLLVESPNPANSQLQWHKNISQSADGFVFESTPRTLNNDTAPFTHPGRYRYFDYADADGDGIRDLLNAGSIYQRLYFVKGVHPAAPKAVTDLTVDSRSHQRTIVSFTRPEGAQKFNIRWSTATIPDSLNLASCKSVTDIYTVPVGQRQTFQLPPNPSDARVFASVWSLNADAQTSGPSNPLDFIPAPAKVQLLTAAAAVTLSQANAPNTDKQGLAILNPSANLNNGASRGDALVTLVHFDALPQTPVSHATLRLTTLASNGAMLLDGAATVSCSMVDLPAPVDFPAATWQQSAPATPWPNDYLLKTAPFLSFGAPVSAVMSAEPVVRWDVTPALEKARAQGKSSVTLLLRVDYTGHYTAGGGRYHGANAADPAKRPALELVFK